MGFKNIRDYIFRELIFPKIFIVDEPGIIVNYASIFYGLKQNKKRIMYFFEDDFVNLQKDTILKIGKKDASLLYYKIGKSFVTRHLGFSDLKTPPPFLKSYLIKKAFESFLSAGMTIVENFSFNEKDNSFVASGKNNIISRKTKDVSLFCGIVSGTLSYFCGVNIEAKSTGPEKIIANQNIEKIYIPSFNQNIDLVKYNRLNFPIEKNMPSPYCSSLRNLIKFNQVQYKEGKHYFNGHLIIPMEIGISDIYVKYYRQSGLLDILKQSLLRSSEQNAKSLFCGESISNNLNKFSSMLSGLGWGRLIIKVEKDKIFCHIVSAPITEGDFFFQSIILNGYLNCIFDKKYNLSFIKTCLSKVPKLMIAYEVKEKYSL